MHDLLRRVRQVLPALPLATALCALACSAAPNPVRPSEPASYTPPAPAATQEPEPSAPPTPREALAAQAAKDAAATAGVPSVATVAGKPIDVAALLGELMHDSLPEVFAALDGLVVERFVQYEAARLAVVVESEDVEARYRADVADIEDAIHRSRPSVDLDTFVGEVLGLDPQHYRARLRRRALHEELARRIYRAYFLTSDHALARMLVVPTEEAAQGVLARLEAGEDFVALAREVSIEREDPEARGRIVPVVRSETLMSRLVFQTPVGEVAGPSRELGAYVFVRVEERAPPLAGKWPDLVEAVEASLAERPIDPLEIDQWRTAMGRRYEVDTRPLFRLAGEPTE